MKLSGVITAYHEREIDSIREVKFPTPWPIRYTLSGSPRERGGHLT
jgi:hypothetical protein